jgi:hypothetical protein
VNGSDVFAWLVIIFLVIPLAIGLIGGVIFGIGELVQSWRHHDDEGEL